MSLPIISQMVSLIFNNQPIEIFLNYLIIVLLQFLKTFDELIEHFSVRFNLAESLLHQVAARIIGFKMDTCSKKTRIGVRWRFIRFQLGWIDARTNFLCKCFTLLDMLVLICAMVTYLKANKELSHYLAARSLTQQSLKQYLMW